MESSENVKKLIGAELKDSSEEIPEAFTCCLCLELLYKPIILACGHVSCFWCVHQSMNPLCESHCPTCRRAYHHFPTICQMLHLIIMKMYPIEYKRREIQITEFEKQMDCFSPQIAGPKEQIKQEVCNGDSSQLQGEDIVPGNKKDLHERTAKATCQKISVRDAWCTSCNQLVYCSVALNCGHVYCQSCVIQANEKIKCVECQIAHPGETPTVCLKLDNFLEEQFPTEYATRKNSVQLKQPYLQEESPGTCSSGDLKNKFHLLTSSGNNKLHLSVGCDSCGMFPIIGDRYKCKDCVEQVGFDLCEDCYTTRSKLPGRFNQQHTPEHRFELERSNVSDIMLSILRNMPSSFVSLGCTEVDLPNHQEEGDLPNHQEDDLV